MESKPNPACNPNPAWIMVVRDKKHQIKPVSPITDDPATRDRDVNGHIHTSIELRETITIKRNGQTKTY